MTLHFDPDIAYECVQCGRGCFNKWDIHVEPSVVQRLKGSPLELRVIQERGRAFEGPNIYKDADHPRCGFLESDNLCSIHREMGYEAKPLTCQQYPFSFTQVPGGDIYVSAAYSCTAVREEVGPPLEDSRESIEDLLRRGGRVHRIEGPIPVLEPFFCSWEDFQNYDWELERRLGTEGFPAALEDAVAGLGALLSRHGRPAGVHTLAEGELASSWALGRAAGDQVRSQLRLISMVLSMGLLKPCLDTKDRAIWQNIDEAMLGGADLVLPEFGWSAPLADLELWVNQGVGSHFDSAILRYQRSLLFRKVHLTMGGLLPGLILTWLKPPILRLLTGLRAWKEQEEPHLRHFHWALERAETCLVAHTFDTVQVYQQGGWQAIAVSSAFSL